MLCLAMFMRKNLKKYITKIVCAAYYKSTNVHYSARHKYINGFYAVLILRRARVDIHEMGRK